MLLDTLYSRLTSMKYPCAKATVYLPHSYIKFLVQKPSHKHKI